MRFEHSPEGSYRVVHFTKDYYGVMSFCCLLAGPMTLNAAVSGGYDNNAEDDETAVMQFSMPTKEDFTYVRILPHHLAVELDLGNRRIV